ncbi:MAG: alanine--glyoxylate aminotransferase family protein [Actinobacteria bacterium]|nr:alanine--glyoxylate aminotransferase family protein [Actinomycetota bacterium]MBV8396986.1 alanine--glyoxylate aminotransferase family protein [Actinomycetota bacterium]
MEKRYLFTPGPTPVPPEVLAAMAEPMVHHRGSDFRAVYERALERLRDVFRTKADVLLFAASGTGAMDSAAANLCTPGQRVAVVTAGAFGDRWVALCEQYGLDVQKLAYEWGEAPSPDEVGAAVRESGAGVVFCTHSETSTGVVADVQGLKQAVGDATLVVDAISSLGAVPLETDAWGIDVVLSGSQKALMCPPGLAMASVADPLWERLPQSRSFYFDWRRARKAQEMFDAAFTPAVSLIRGLEVALGLIAEAGLDAAFERHVRLGRAARAGLKAMGLELFSPDDDSSAVVTVANVPDGIDGGELLRHLRDRHGVTLAPGQGHLKGKIFRIGHIGWFDVFDIAAALAAVELSLTELGADVERGVAVPRAFEAYDEHVAV